MRVIFTLIVASQILLSCGNVKETKFNSNGEKEISGKEQRMIDKCTQLEIPSSFSPNGDSVNDSFSVGSQCELTKFKFKVFNRWGDEIYSTSDQYFVWDGSSPKITGNLPVGTYYYTCEFRYSYNDYDLSSYISVIY